MKHKCIQYAINALCFVALSSVSFTIGYCIGGIFKNSDELEVED